MIPIQPPFSPAPGREDFARISHIVNPAIEYDILGVYAGPGGMFLVAEGNGDYVTGQPVGVTGRGTVLASVNAYETLNEAIGYAMKASGSGCDCGKGALCPEVSLASPVIGVSTEFTLLGTDPAPVAGGDELRTLSLRQSEIETIKQALDYAREDLESRARYEDRLSRSWSEGPELRASADRYAKVLALFTGPEGYDQ